VLLVRYRFQLLSQQGDRENAMLAEESALLAYEGSPEDPKWLPTEEGERLLQTVPSSNLPKEVAMSNVAQVVAGLETLARTVDAAAHSRAAALLETHRRVRQGAGLSGSRLKVEPKLPADILGIFVYLPELASSR
jgi:hypothetical protein